MRTRRNSLWALLLTFSFIALPAVAVPAGAAPVANPILISEIVDVTPIVGPGDEVEVSVSVRNDGEEIIKDASLDLRFRSAQLISRSAVELWEQPDEDSVFDLLGPEGTVVISEELADLNPGQERLVKLRISTEKLYLPRSPSQWGPRGIAVDTKIGSDLVARERTFILWFPATQDQVFPTQLSVLAPLAGTPPGGLDGEAQGDRLQKVLDATSEREVSYAIDPYLLSGTETQTAVPHIRKRLKGREVFALPKFDADVTSLAQIDELRAADYLQAARSAISSELDTSASDILLWPEGQADTSLADFAAAQESLGVGAIITGPTQLLPVTPLTYTPSGKARIATDAGLVTALIPDSELSTTLTAAATDGVTSSTALARQRLLADTAVITQERPADPRHVLVTLPRNWNPDPERAQELLSALTAAPWVELEAVRTLIGAPSGQVEREPLPLKVEPGTDLDGQLVKSAKAAQTDLNEFRSIIERPDLVLPLADIQLAGIVSNGWRHSPDERDALVAEISREVKRLQNSVNVIPAGAVNLVTDAGEIPVIIKNEFHQEVSVQVRLETDSSFLKTTQVITAEVPADSESSVLVPVEAIGNRDVEVAVNLETENGGQIGEPQTITVRVRAGWEDAGTRVIGAVLIVLFVIGIIRTVRRAQKRRKS